jgi:pimeloyl-ACP methyl ester carboxylesterase
MSTIVFVHGACVRDAPWWWSRMVAPLEARGIASAAVPLPSCGEAGPRLGDLYDDVEATRQVVAGAEPPVILLGHSYGGVVITEVGAHEAVTHLCYVASLMPDAGDSLASIAGAEPAPWMDPGDDGTVGVIPEIVRDLFLQDCDAATADAALARLTRQSAAPFAQPPRAIAWRDKPWTYFVCTEDLAIPADVQRSRARDERGLVDIHTGHHPFLAQPEMFADALATAGGTT